MRQSYLKNAALLTGSDVVLRLAGMGLRIYLANALGGEGMGLYQLVLAVYSLFVTLATAGVSAASTRLMAEELAGRPARARGMLARLCAAALGLGCAAMAGQWLLAPAAARWWLGDARAAAALRAAAFGMPFMAVSAVLRGFFVARQRVGPNVASQMVEQAFRIGVMAAALELTEGRDAGVRCAVVLGATAASEAVSALLMAAFLQAGSAPRLWPRPGRGPAPRRAAPVGDPVAGRGRPVRGQRPAHRRKYAGARLPDGLSGPAGRGGEPVRRAEGDGPAAGELPVWAAGQPGGAADARDRPGPACAATATGWRFCWGGWSN